MNVVNGRGTFKFYQSNGKVMFKIHFILFDKIKVKVCANQEKSVSGIQTDFFCNFFMNC